MKQFAPVLTALAILAALLFVGLVALESSGFSLD